MLSKKTWRWPRHSPVLIFDANGEEYLLEYCKSSDPEVLHVRGEQTNMRVLLASLFRKGRRSIAYIDSFVEKVQPRLIVTFIDNSPEFYSLAVRHPSIKTLFVQNGTRGYFGDVFEILDSTTSVAGELEVDYMMTFGNRVGAEYARYINGAVVPMGSLKNNLYPKSRRPIPGTIAFISQYRRAEGISLGEKCFSHEEFFARADRLVLQFLAKYVEERGKKLTIVPCANYSRDGTLTIEREYYNRLLGSACNFSEWNWDGSSYDALDSSEVVVSIDSTLAYESAARGNRTAIFSIRSALLGVRGLTFGWPADYPAEGPFWTNRPDALAFERILDHLFAVDEEQWRAELSQCGFDDIIIYDPGNSALQAVLASELGEPRPCGLGAS